MLLILLTIEKVYLFIKWNYSGGTLQIPNCIDEYISIVCI